MTAEYDDLSSRPMSDEEMNVFCITIAGIWCAILLFFFLFCEPVCDNTHVKQQTTQTLEFEDYYESK